MLFTQSGRVDEMLVAMTTTAREKRARQFLGGEGKGLTANAVGRLTH